MSRKIKIAPVQMDATPAPLSNRLSRATKLVAGWFVGRASWLRK